MRRLTTAIACTLALTLSACGGDGGGPVDRALDDMDDLEDAINGAVEDGGAQAGIESGPTEAQPPEFVLTGDVEPPVGWIEDPASCMDDRIGPPYFTYSVPADWTQTGSGHAGCCAAGRTAAGNIRRGWRIPFPAAMCRSATARPDDRGSRRRAVAGCAPSARAGRRCRRCAHRSFAARRAAPGRGRATARCRLRTWRGAWRGRSRGKPAVGSEGSDEAAEQASQ